MQNYIGRYFQANDQIKQKVGGINLNKAELRAEKLWLSRFPENPKWKKLRKKYKNAHPECAVCEGRSRSNEVHHIKPVHEFPELALDEDNLITLCKDGANHHLFVGHLMSYKSWNENIRVDAILWNARIKSRPKPKKAYTRIGVK